MERTGAVDNSPRHSLNIAILSIAIGFTAPLMGHKRLGSIRFCNDA